MPHSNEAEKFLDAFNRIEAVHLEGAKREPRDGGFSPLVRHSSELTVSHNPELREMADLRDVIVRSPRDDRFEIYADRRSSTVDWIEG